MEKRFSVLITVITVALRENLESISAVVAEESLESDTHSHRQTDRQTDPGSNPSRVRWDFLSRSAPTQSRPAEGLMGRLLPHSRDLSTSRIRLLVCFLQMTHCATCLSLRTVTPCE